MSIPSRSRFARSFVPRLETLEDRRCPSTLTVRTAADNGLGSLRAAIAAAAAGDSIEEQQAEVPEPVGSGR